MRTDSPTAPPVDQDQLETFIEQCVLARTSIRELRAQVHDGKLVLRGVTTTFYSKQLAQHIAMEVSQLPIVDNGIEVR